MNAYCISQYFLPSYLKISPWSSHRHDKSEYALSKVLRATWSTRNRTGFDSSLNTSNLFNDPLIVEPCYDHYVRLYTKRYIRSANHPFTSLIVTCPQYRDLSYVLLRATDTTKWEL